MCHVPDTGDITKQTSVSVFMEFSPMILHQEKLFIMIKKKRHYFHERDKWRKILTASLRTSLFIGKMCSIRTKGKREERISLSSSMSRSRLFTPLLFTLWAVPLSKFGSMTETENERSPLKSKFPEKGSLSSLSILSVTLYIKFICFIKCYK